MASKMTIGYISRRNLEMNPHFTERFKFTEATFTRKINSRGDKVYSKMLLYPVDYEEIVDNANIMKQKSKLDISKRTIFYLTMNCVTRFSNG